MLLQVSFLAEAFVTLITLESFNACVETYVVFDITRFIESFPTTIYQTFNIQVKLEGLRVEYPANLVVLLRYSFEGIWFDVEVLVIHERLELFFHLRILFFILILEVLH